MSIRVEIDDRVRLTSSALLLTRFREEQSCFKHHPLNDIVFHRIENHKQHPFIKLVNQLSENYWMDKFFAMAVSLELCDGVFVPNPELKYSFPDNYGEMIQQFSQDARLNELWCQTSLLWDRVCSDCSMLLSNGNVEDFLELMFGPISQKLIVIPAPLIPPSFGFGISNQNATYSVVGPPAISIDDEVIPEYIYWGTLLTSLVVHEFSHSLLLAEEGHDNLVERTSHLEGSMHLSGYFPDLYSNWEGQLNEMIVRAIEILYLSEEEGEAVAQRRMEKEIEQFGVTLIEPIFYGLKKYIGNRRVGECAKLSSAILESIR